jgi:hypothetical protein
MIKLWIKVIKKENEVSKQSFENHDYSLEEGTFFSISSFSSQKGNLRLSHHGT